MPIVLAVFLIIAALANGYVAFRNSGAVLFFFACRDGVLDALDQIPDSQQPAKYRIAVAMIAFIFVTILRAAICAAILGIVLWRSYAWYFLLGATFVMLAIDAVAGDSFSACLADAGVPAVIWLMMTHLRPRTWERLMAD